jgi:DNA-binding response OmpR family regulator
MQRGFEAGADEYLRKPFAPRELGEVVEALIRDRTSARSRRA